MSSPLKNLMMQKHKAVLLRAAGRQHHLYAVCKSQWLHPQLGSRHKLPPLLASSHEQASDRAQDHAAVHVVQDDAVLRYKTTQLC